MKQLKVTPLHVCSQLFKNYSYIVFNQESKNALIIDPAWELEKYLEALNDFGVTLTHILLTHTHFDHIGLVDYFAVNFKTKVWVSKNERSRLPLASDFIRTFSHMEVLRLNSLECKAFLTPGHSPGSSCFLIGSNLFSGDTLFIEGCGICDDPDANPGHLYESLMFIKNEFPLSVKVYPGHRFQVKYSSKGKPFLDPYYHMENLSFNLSYTEMFALIVASDIAQVGIDVEYLRSIPSLNSIMKSTLSLCEQSYVRSMPKKEQSRAFLVLLDEKKSYFEGDRERS